MLIEAMRRTRTMTRLELLLDRALAVLPAHLRDQVVVFGSAPMVLAGLKPDVGDLDFFVSEKTFEELVAAGFVADEKLGHPRIVLAEDVEVFKTWPGLGFGEVYAEAVPVEGSRGLRVASLRHVLAFKLVTNREKDRADVEVLRRILGS
jgi:hypothetical protein